LDGEFGIRKRRKDLKLPLDVSKLVKGISVISGAKPWGAYIIVTIQIDITWMIFSW
jgi:hypothetical protein